MHSTLNGAVPTYLGADLTDRYSRSCREIDVCGLTLADGRLAARFWRWGWDAAPQALEVSIIAGELAATRSAMVDGPMGLAAEGSALRACERMSAAVGKTPHARPDLVRPFAGFICSSIDLFASLHDAGIRINPSGFTGGVSEVYPGHIWNLICGRHVLPKKSTDRGRLARREILEAIGVVGLPQLPSHDQNDACIAAVMAAAADGSVPGMTARGIGFPLAIGADGVLREGLMVIPDIGDQAARSLARVLTKVPVIGDRPGRTGAVNPEVPGSPLDRATALLDQFIIRACEGVPQVCTYSWAYRELFAASYDKFSQAYVRPVIEVAASTPLRELPGLGLVRFDAFVVAKVSGLPGEGHWQPASYDREDWERVLGSALVLD